MEILFLFPNSNCRHGRYFSDWFIASQANIMATWCGLLIGIVGLVLLLFAVQHFFGAMTELSRSLLDRAHALSEFPAVILLLVAWQLVSRRAKSILVWNILW